MTSPEELRLECTNDNGVARAVAFHATGSGRVRALLFDEALVEGDECEITPRFAPCQVTLDDPRYSGTARFTVTAAAPIPTSLGALEAKARRYRDVPVPTNDGSCVHERQACAAQVMLRLSEEAQPWANALDFETLVDGDVWIYSSLPDLYRNDRDPEPGTDIVFAANAETARYGIDPGRHAIAMRAKLAGIDEAVRSDELELDLICKGPLPSETDGRGGCSAMGRRPASSTSFDLMVLLFALAALWRTRSRLAR